MFGRIIQGQLSSAGTDIAAAFKPSGRGLLVNLLLPFLATFNYGTTAVSNLGLALPTFALTVLTLGLYKPVRDMFVATLAGFIGSTLACAGLLITWPFAWLSLPILAGFAIRNEVRANQRHADKAVTVDPAVMPSSSKQMLNELNQHAAPKRQTSFVQEANAAKPANTTIAAKMAQFFGALFNKSHIATAPKVAAVLRTDFGVRR